MSFFDGLFKVAVDIVEMPIAVVKDAITLGGVLTDDFDETHTEKKIKDISKNLSDIAK